MHTKFHNAASWSLLIRAMYLRHNFYYRIAKLHKNVFPEILPNLNMLQPVFLSLFRVNDKLFYSARIVRLFSQGQCNNLLLINISCLERTFNRHP